MLKVSIIFSLTFIVFCNGFNRVPGSYDQIVLNQSHPITAFWSIKNQWPIENYGPEYYSISQGACQSLKNSSHWIINSLWPSKNNDYHPQYCFRGIIYHDSIQIENNLQFRLSQEWPTYELREDDKYLWNVAWIKHGTCMNDLQQTDSPQNYFNKAVELIDQYNIGAILHGSNIRSGRSYSLHHIRNAIVGILHVDPNLRCIVDEGSPWREQYLSEASLCMSRSFQLETCIVSPPYQHPTIMCDTNKAVYIPELLSAL